MCKCFLVVVVVVVVKVHMHVESVPCTAELRTTRIRTVSYSCMVYSVGGTYAIRTPAVCSIVRAVCCAACPQQCIFREIRSSMRATVQTVARALLVCILAGGRARAHALTHARCMPGT